MLQKTCPKRAGLFYATMLFLHQDNLFAAKGDAVLQDFLDASCLNSRMTPHFSLRVG